MFIAVLGSLVWLFVRYPFGCTILIILFLLLLALLTASCANRDGTLPSSTVPASAAVGAKAGGEGADPVRVRQNFPETLLWRPELITDDQGRAHLDVDLADSITTCASRSAPSRPRGAWVVRNRRSGCSSRSSSTSTCPRP